MRSIVCLIPLLAVAVLVTGCVGDDPLKRYPVKGTATFDGAPIPEGDILFVPDGGDGRPEGGPIKNGEFSVELVPGRKRVEIRASKENPAKMIDSMLEPGKKVPAREDYIPAKYNDKSELTAETSDVTDPLQFDLKSE